MKEHRLRSDDFLVSQTDDKGVILFANEDFCRACGYTIDELVGQNHNIVRHPEMPKVAFKGLWETVRGGKIWDGYVKNKTKDGGYYWVYATVYPQYNKLTKQSTYMSCRRRPSSKEISAAEALYKTLT